MRAVPRTRPILQSAFGTTSHPTVNVRIRHFIVRQRHSWVTKTTLMSGATKNPEKVTLLCDYVPLFFLIIAQRTWVLASVGEDEAGEIGRTSETEGLCDLIEGKICRFNKISSLKQAMLRDKVSGG